MRHYCIYLILLLLVSLFSCTGKEHKQSVTVSKKDMKSSMETANRYLLNEEEEDIMNYVKRHGLDMTSTGTGLRYQKIGRVSAADVADTIRRKREAVLSVLLFGAPCITRIIPSTTSSTKVKSRLQSP